MVVSLLDDPRWLMVSRIGQFHNRNSSGEADMTEYYPNLVDRNGQIVRAETLNTSAEVAAMMAKLVDVSHDVVVWHQNRLLVLRHGSKHRAEPR
jgi:hypothetical protein